jgi:hypothetical protein
VRDQHLIYGAQASFLRFSACIESGFNAPLVAELEFDCCFHRSMQLPNDRPVRIQEKLLVVR